MVKVKVREENVCARYAQARHERRNVLEAVACVKHYEPVFCLYGSTHSVARARGEPAVGAEEEYFHFFTLGIFTHDQGNPVQYQEE